MYANYAVWEGGLGRPKDDFFSGEGGSPSAGRGNLFWGGRIG